MLRLTQQYHSVFMSPLPGQPSLRITDSITLYSGGLNQSLQQRPVLSHLGMFFFFFRQNQSQLVVETEISRGVELSRNVLQVWLGVDSMNFDSLIDRVSEKA